MKIEEMTEDWKRANPLVMAVLMDDRLEIPPDEDLIDYPCAPTWIEAYAEQRMTRGHPAGTEIVRHPWIQDAVSDEGEVERLRWEVDMLGGRVTGMEGRRGRKRMVPRVI